MNASPHESLKPVAREVLGVDEEATPDACRLAFIWRLAEEEFMPPAVMLDAAMALGIIPGPGEDLPCLASHHEQKFNEQLDQFVGEYWDLAPDARGQAWRRLNRQTDEFPRARERLSRLKTGLPLSLPADDREMYLPLIQCCERVYVAPEARRARLMNAILEEHGLQPPELSLLATTFLGQHPDFGRLFEQLRLTDAATRIKRSIEAEDEKRTKRNPVASQAGASKRRNNYGWPYYLACFLVIAVIRILLVDQKSKPSPTIDPPRTGSFQIDRDRFLNPSGKVITQPVKPLPDAADDPDRAFNVPGVPRPKWAPPFQPQGPPLPGNP